MEITNFLNILDVVVFVFSIFVFMNLVVYTARLRSKNKKAILTVAQLVIDKNILESKIIELDKVVHSQEKEHFLKFLNDSRDAAFEYIEKSQDTVRSFISSIEKDIKHFDTYGAAVTNVYDKLLTKVSIGLDELRELLPEEKEDGDIR
jgi:hypothetical protein